MYTRRYAHDAIWLLRLLGALIIGLSLAIPLPTAAEDFTIIVLPDTQHYSESYPDIYLSQTQWIVANKDPLNIVYVAHVGDVVNSADQVGQWQNADTAMSLLEDPVTTSLPDGIPYGIAPGNHDHWPEFDPQGTQLYNEYFGVSRFSGRAYYGGHYGTENSNHFSLFSAGGMDFIVIDLDIYSGWLYALDWADNLLKTYPNRRAIVVSHYILDIGDPAPFGIIGQDIYDALKDNPNLFLMLCGHQHGEGKRVDLFEGNTVHSLLADYQDYTNGGNGFLRILEFSPANSEISVKTYSPYLDQYETDADSQFTLSYDMTLTVEITVKQGITEIPNGTGSYDFGSVDLNAQSTVSFRITNTGNSRLELTGDPIIAISGGEAADFDVTQPQTDVIEADSSLTFDVQFMPGAEGERITTVSIDNNDEDENPYLFTLRGYGCPLTAPDKVAQISPAGTVFDFPFSYVWEEEPCAAWYRLYVQDDATGTSVVDGWFEAASAEMACAGGTCVVTPEIQLGIGSYTWWVQPWNPAGFGPWSDGLTFTGVPPAAAEPVTPTGAITDCPPVFTWNTAEGADWYRVWIGSNAGGSWVASVDQWYDASTICTTETCSVQVPLFNGDYQWWVQTWNAYGEGPWSAEGLSFSLSDCCDTTQGPAPITQVAPTGTTEICAPTFTWNEDPCVWWYYLWVGDEMNTAFISQWYQVGVDVICTGGECALSPDIMLPNGNYSWYLWPWNPAGEGGWSSGMSFTVNGTCCAPPAAVTQTAPSGTISDSTPTYTWDEHVCADWYRLWVGSNTSGTWIAYHDQWYEGTTVCTGGTCDVTPTTSLPYNSYSWWIQPWNSLGLGNWSAGMNFTVGQAFTVQKRGTGNGTILTDTQICGPDCPAFSLPYINQATIGLEALPDAESVFVGWETEDGTPLENIYYAQPGATVYAVFEKRQ